MLELILLIISFFCLFFSAEASVTFLLIAVGTLAYKRRILQIEAEKMRVLLADLSQNVHREVNQNAAKVDKLAKELAALREVGTVVAEPVAAPKAAAPVQEIPVVPTAPETAPVAPPRPVVEAPRPTQPAPPVVENPRPAPPPLVVENPVAPKPEPPAVAPPRPPVPVGPVIPPASTAPPPRPVAPPPPIGSVQPRPSASYQVPPARPAMRKPETPKRSLGEQLASVLAFEEVLGKNWLSKIGIVLFVIGVASYGVYELGSTAMGKVALCFIGAALLLGGGIFFERKERYQILGRTGIGGGWALLFFTFYAIHHVAAMRILESETLDLLLMLFVAVAMALHTLRYKSQVVTGIAFLLAYSTITLSHDSVYALSAGAVLAIGIVIITVRMQWYELEIFGILSSYLNHLYWLYKILGPEGPKGPFPEFYPSTAILLVYWASYRFSYVVRRISSKAQESTSAIAAILNTLLLLAVMKFQSVHPELAFYVLLTLGAIEFACGQLPITRRRRDAFVLLSVIGAALMVMAVPFKFSGNNVAILWFIGAEAFLAAGIILKELVFRRLGMITGVLVGLHVLFIDCVRLYQTRILADKSVITGGTLLLTCGVLFYLNAHSALKRFPQLFTDSFDRKLLQSHSYFGAITVTFAAWALFVLDWTTVAWIVVVASLAWLGRHLHSRDLLIQSSVVAVLAFFRTFAINMHLERASTVTVTHYYLRYVTVPIIAIGFYLAAYWIVQQKDRAQELLRAVFAWAGTICLAVLVSCETPHRYEALGLVGLALVLTEAGLFLNYKPLAWHVHLLTVLSAVSAIFYDGPVSAGWHGLNATTLVAALTAVAAYWLSYRTPSLVTQKPAETRDTYTWVAAVLVSWLMWEQLPNAWIAVGWIAFGICLALIGRRLRLAHLCYQENLLAIGAIFSLFVSNFTLNVSGTFNLRLLTVVLVAAGLYGISRKSALAATDYGHITAYSHTWAATGLLALLAWYEAPTAWLIVVWAVFALVLAAVARQFKLAEIPWQVHVLAVLTAARAVTVNIYIVQTFHGLSLRLVSLVVVIATFYFLSRLIPFSEQLRRSDFHHAYTWVASFIASLLLWYELQPVSVALAWALFALVLFELGHLRDIRQLRLQAYAGFIASFVRIFFVNLAAPNRLTTVVPLVLIYFFAYAQMKVSENEEESRWSIDVILAYIGSLTIASLLYFQVTGGWIATSWAVLTFALLAAAVLLDREVFLHQALLLSIAAFLRGVMHNLFGASYFADGTWSGRYLELGSAAFVMLASLPFAYQLKNKYPPAIHKSSFGKLLARASARPEQVMFFVPIFLVTLMLALKMRAGMVTVAWGIEGVLVILLALAVGERSFRLSGLTLLLLCVGKILLVDAWRLAPRDRYLTFIVLGLALLGVSFLYSKYRETVRQFL